MRKIRRLAMVVLVLSGLLLIADRVGAWVAGRVIAEQAAQELAAYEVRSAPPEATIDGFPFLTQVVAGQYEMVTLRLRDVGAEGLRLPRVELTATDVDAPLETLIERSGPVHADRVVGTAVIGYASVVALTEVPGLELSPAGNGSAHVRLPAELLGVPLVLVGTADLAVTGNTIQLLVSELRLEGSEELPPGADALLSQLARTVSVAVTLPSLPYGLTLESVRAETEGLAVTLSARDVLLAS